MARLRFAKGTKYLHSGQVYVIEQVLLEGRLRVVNHSSGGIDVVSRDDLLRAWERGELTFALTGPNTRIRRKGIPATEYRFADFSGLPEALREESFRRYELIKPYLPMSRKERGRAWTTLAERRKSGEGESVSDNSAAIDGSESRAARRPNAGDASQDSAGVPNGEVLPSPRSLQRWLKAFEESGYDVRSLVPSSGGGKDGLRLDDAVEEIVDSVLDEKKALIASGTVPAVSIDGIHSAVISRIDDTNLTRDKGKKLRFPSPNTIHRRVQSKGMEYLLHRAQSLEEERQQAPVFLAPRATRVLQVVELDQTIPDLMIVDFHDRLPLGRPYTTQGRDKYSKMPFGEVTSFEPNNSVAVAACLLDGISPGEDIRTLYGTKNAKLTFGLPERIVVDNGKCFVGKDLEDACASLGITLERLPVRTPHLKGDIERWFKTTNEALLHYLPGTTFSNIFERGDYDPMRTACITHGAYKKLMHIWMYDIYAQRVHRGTKRIPAKVWEESAQIHPPALPHSARDLRILLLSVEHRTLQRYGIDLHDLRYQSDALSPLRSKLRHGGGDKRVKLKYDPQDLRVIFVLDPYDEKWIEVPVSAEYSEYSAGLSLWKHRMIHKYAKNHMDKADLAALAKSKLEMQRIVEEEFDLRAQRGRTRKLHARYLNIGKSRVAPERQADSPKPQPAIAAGGGELTPAPDSQPAERATAPLPRMRPGRDEDRPDDEWSTAN